MVATENTVLQEDIKPALHQTLRRRRGRLFNMGIIGTKVAGVASIGEESENNNHD